MHLVDWQKVIRELFAEHMPEDTLYIVKVEEEVDAHYEIGKIVITIKGSITPQGSVTGIGKAIKIIE